MNFKNIKVGTKLVCTKCEELAESSVLLGGLYTVINLGDSKICTIKDSMGIETVWSLDCLTRQNNHTDFTNWFIQFEVVG